MTLAGRLPVCRRPAQPSSPSPLPSTRASFRSPSARLVSASRSLHKQQTLSCFAQTHCTHVPFSVQQTEPKEPMFAFSRCSVDNAKCAQNTRRASLTGRRLLDLLLDGGDGQRLRFGGGGGSQHAGLHLLLHAHDRDPAAPGRRRVRLRLRTCVSGPSSLQLISTITPSLPFGTSLIQNNSFTLE